MYKNLTSSSYVSYRQFAYPKNCEVSHNSMVKVICLWVTVTYIFIIQLHQYPTRSFFSTDS